MLTERQLEIVFAVVYEYIKTGEPVGSRTISRKFLKSHSAATIRNEMSDLEELGYFTQPHSSAGRLPTSMAYRVYVNSILHRPAVPPPEIEHWLHQAADQLRSLDDRIAEAAQFLGRFTRCFSVAAIAAVQARKLRKVDFIRLAPQLLLLLLVTENGTVHHTRLRVSPELTQEQFDTFAAAVNSVASGQPWDTVRASVIETLRHHAGPQWEDFRPVFEAVDELMCDEGLTMSTGGMREVFSADDDVTAERRGRIEAITSLIDKKEELEELISDYTSTDGLKVTIGDENHRPDMQGCTVIMSTSTNNSRKAIVGLVGPLRMNYQTSIAVLGAVLDSLNTSPGKEDTRA